MSELMNVRTRTRFETEARSIHVAYFPTQNLPDLLVLVTGIDYFIALIG